MKAQSDAEAFEDLEEEWGIFQTCNMCGLRFPSFAALIFHLKSVHKRYLPKDESQK